MWSANHVAAARHGRTSASDPSSWPTEAEPDLVFCSCRSRFRRVDAFQLTTGVKSGYSSYLSRSPRISLSSRVFFFFVCFSHRPFCLNTGPSHRTNGRPVTRTSPTRSGSFPTKRISRLALQYLYVFMCSKSQKNANSTNFFKFLIIIERKLTLLTICTQSIDFKRFAK